MKKLVVVLSIVLVILMTASTLPPSFPSSFWGYVSGARIGSTITVTVNGVQVAYTKVFSYNGAPVYTINVPMDTVRNGDIAKFYIGKVLYGSSKLSSGTNIRLDLYPIKNIIKYRTTKR